MRRLGIVAVGLVLVVGTIVGGIVGNAFDGRASASTAAVGGRLIELGTGTISGVVTDEGGSPIQGCWMYARPYSGSNTERVTQTGPDGAYTIAGLTAGSYRVQAQCAGHVWEYWDDHLLWWDADPVPVTEGSNTPNINFSLRIGGTVSGTVTDSGGNPIFDAWVSAVPFAGGYGFPSVLTVADGTYTTGGLFTGQYRVEVWVPGYVGEYWDDHAAYEDADPVAVTEGLDTPDINFSLRVDGTISGVVTGAGGSPIAGCWVYASPYTGSGSEAEAYTGPDGAYSIGYLATGSYRVQAPCTGYVNQYWDDALAYEDADPVPVTEGSNTPNIDFSLEEQDTDNDGCVDVEEIRIGTDSTDPWDFFSVPVPALFAAPDPTAVFRDSSVTPQDAQAVFSYYAHGARAGQPVYEQDLNLNGVKDGWEYDRSIVGPGMTGPPDGATMPQDAQAAFAQYAAGFFCTP